jgi:hypothetical protein
MLNHGGCVAYLEIWVFDKGRKFNLTFWGVLIFESSREKGPVTAGSMTLGKRTDPID